jgi:DNA-binding transcriptional MerR regulator
MTNSLRIADVADRTGISTATVRYYERIGVLPEPERAGNGYRIYDDRTVEQLRFIGRAKQLGCSLEEIADLATAWSGGECGPVQDQLRALVADKLAAAQTEIVELVTLTADLQRAAEALERHRPVGRCDDSCGCVTEPANRVVASRTTTPIELIRRHNGETRDGEAPIACTLPTDHFPDRLDDWNTLLRDARRTPIEDGVRVELSDTIDVADLARLAAAEQDCCRFFAFKLTIDQRGTALEVTAPAEAIDTINAAFGAPA